MDFLRRANYSMTTTIVIAASPHRRDDDDDDHMIMTSTTTTTIDWTAISEVILDNHNRRCAGYQFEELDLLTLVVDGDHLCGVGVVRTNEAKYIVERTFASSVCVGLFHHSS